MKELDRLIKKMSWKIQGKIQDDKLDDAAKLTDMLAKLLKAKNS